MLGKNQYIDMSNVCTSSDSNNKNVSFQPKRIKFITRVAKTQ